MCICGSVCLYIICRLKEKIMTKTQFHDELLDDKFYKTVNDSQKIKGLCDSCTNTACNILFLKCLH